MKCLNRQIFETCDNTMEILASVSLPHPTRCPEPIRLTLLLFYATVPCPTDSHGSSNTRTSRACLTAPLDPADRAVRDKAKHIRAALERSDVAELRKLSISRGGLLSGSYRRRAWSESFSQPEFRLYPNKFIVILVAKACSYCVTSNQPTRTPRSPTGTGRYFSASM
jgi:hypothetical protein